MNYLSLLALFGHLVTILARPEVGYNYARPLQTQSFSQQQFGSSFQPGIPQINNIQQQQFSHQHNPPQFNPQPFLPPSTQYGVPDIQSVQSNIPISLGNQINSQQNHFGQGIQFGGDNNFLQSQNSFSNQLSTIPSQGFSNFPSQSNFNQFSQQQFSQGNVQQPQRPLISKDIYVHVAPEDPPTPASQVFASSGVPRKHYKIIFIKAPTPSVSQQQILAAAAGPVEEKTLVYVLVNKEQQSQVIQQQVAAAQARSKPEVYFIKYKTKSAPVATQGANFGSNSQGAVIPDQSNNQGVPIFSGESTSSLFSGGLPSSRPTTKYGPPGYQKRSTKDGEKKH